ncbi:hypothetical protein BDF21DRAFT_465941 [Thamnidium elegans]|nr:hypothetical protein BDF21DRAFT_465941 [Thamnidium elegans]
MNQVVAYTTDGLSFIEYMIKAGISNILKGTKPESQNLLNNIALATTDRLRLSNYFLNALVDCTFSKYDNTSYTIYILTQCFLKNIVLRKVVAPGLEKPDSRREVFQSPPYLHGFLSRTPFDYETVNSRTTYYRTNEKYDEAAITYFNLAEQGRIDPSKRTISVFK